MRTLQATEPTAADMRTDGSWPMLKQYDAAHLRRIALPIGGIGTGTVSLGGRGNLRDWEIVNRPAKKFVPGGWLAKPAPFVALWARSADGQPVTRVMEGPIDPADYEGDVGCHVPNHTLPRFRHCSFTAAYPLGQVHLSDPDVPLTVRLEAFNPFVPGDAQTSGLPVAVLRYVLINPTKEPVAASVCASIPNFIGSDGAEGKPMNNRNQFRRGNGLCGLYMTSEGVASHAPQFGTVALSTTSSGSVTHREAWAKLGWGGTLLDFWDDFSSDGRLEPRDRDDQDDPIGSLAVMLEIPPHGEQAVTFLLTWCFPNRQTWTPAKPSETETCGCACADGCCESDEDTIGNYYTTLYRDAWDAAEQIAPRLPALEVDTIRFVEAFVNSDLPAVVKEAALFNLSTLRTQTVFRTPDGHLFAWEGCRNNRGCCEGSCTHVWNYQPALEFLFGDLARGMREVEFLHATDEHGRMSFRVHLPLKRAQEFGVAAADGQMGVIVRACLTWRLSGDSDWLARLWPTIKRAMAFAWIEGGWDADRDGVMGGCQHNTMDVEYYGPNPQMASWYLAALRACEQMAGAMNDPAFADTCRDLFQRGRKWVDDHLFNGEYYEHHVRPPTGPVAEGLRAELGAKHIDEPEFQLGAACLIDQLVGQYMAHLCNLGHVLNPEHIRTTLASIKRYNFKRGFHDHFGEWRSYALGDEAGMLMATYPRGHRPKEPFPYFAEVMTGFEYVAAVSMIQEGLDDQWLECIKAIRDRYDGWKRNPFNEAECGHHYARALASWAAVLALTGFDYDGITRTMRFSVASKPTRWFWSNGYAWGVLEQSPGENGVKATLRVCGGSLTLDRFELRGLPQLSFAAPCTLSKGEQVTWMI